MTLHRPTNLMGSAAYHEVGEHLANPIAAGTRPLTAEERAARRKRHEDEKKVADTLVAVNNLLFKHHQLLAERGRALLQRVSDAEGYRAIKERLEHVHVGIDMAKPDSDTSAAALVYCDENGKQKVMPVSLQELYRRDIWNRY